jgi:hypothetical protein
MILIMESRGQCYQCFYIALRLNYLVKIIWNCQTILTHTLTHTQTHTHAHTHAPTHARTHTCIYIFFNVGKNSQYFFLCINRLRLYSWLINNILFLPLISPGQILIPVTLTTAPLLLCLIFCTWGSSLFPFFMARHFERKTEVETQDYWRQNFSGYCRDSMPWTSGRVRQCDALDCSANSILRR